MEIQFQLTKSDYIRFNNLYIKDVMTRRSGLVLLALFLVIFVFAGNHPDSGRILLAFISSPIIVIGLFYYISSIVGIFRIERLLSTDISYLEDQRLSVFERGLEQIFKSKTKFWKWQSLKAAYANKEYVYIIRFDKQTIPVPKNAFSSKSEAADFLRLVKKHIYQSTGKQGFPAGDLSKPPYLIGLLCFIPLVGAFVGLALLLYGLIKYKDKWLTLIGAGGILFTILVYSSLFYETTHSSTFKELRVKASQSQINGLMKSIEFYKLKHGVYPDNLIQLNKEDENAWIFDPLQDGLTDKKKTANYNYKKEGNKYYLFSSGLDGKANTNDDIYPQEAPADTSKFGLIIKRG